MGSIDSSEPILLKRIFIRCLRGQPPFIPKKIPLPQSSSFSLQQEAPFIPRKIPLPILIISSSSSQTKQKIPTSFPFNTIVSRPKNIASIQPSSSLTTILHPHHHQLPLAKQPKKTPRHHHHLHMPPSPSHKQIIPKPSTTVTITFKKNFPDANFPHQAATIFSKWKHNLHHQPPSSSASIPTSTSTIPWPLSSNLKRKHSSLNHHRAHPFTTNNSKTPTQNPFQTTATIPLPTT